MAAASQVAQNLKSDFSSGAPLSFRLWLALRDGLIFEELQYKVRFFKKIQDWILKSERIRKWILCFFTTSRMDSSVPLMHHDRRDLGLICLVTKKIRFRIFSDLRIQSPIFSKKRSLIDISSALVLLNLQGNNLYPWLDY